MPFKSDKQRKWMYANEPEMAKKWEKEEAIRERLRKVIRQEIKSVDEGWFDNISQAAQKAYVQKFPNSKFAKNTKKKADDKKAKDSKKTKMSNLASAVEKTEKLYKKHGDKFQKLDKEIDKLGMSIRDNDDGTGRYDPAVKDMKKKMKNLKSWKSHHLDKYMKAQKAGRMAQAKLKDMEDAEEKSESIRPMESINEGFDKYYLSSLLDSKLKKKLEIAIKNLKGKIDGVGDDWIWFRMPSHNIDLLAQLIQRLDKNKNVWIGDKRKKNIWDRRRNIDKLGESKILRAKQMVLLPDKKMYFDPMSNHLWLMGPYGGPDLDDDPIEPRDRDYNKIIRKLSSKDKSVLKKAMRTRKRRKEATTSVSVPGYLSPQAFSKSTQNAIDVDDEDDEKNESINEVRWPDTQTADLLSQAFKDAKVKVQKVWEKGNHEYIIRVRAKDGWTNVRMELNVISNVIMIQSQRKWVRLGELQPGSRGRKLKKNLKMLSTLPSFGVAGFKGLKYKIESINESGILYRAGVKKYGKDGMKKIQQAAGKRKSHAEIGAIKDKYEKDKKESVDEARLVGYDKSYLDNAKKRLKVPHKITNIEYKQTRYRGPHDKFVRIWFKLKWKPGIPFDPEEHWVSVFYDSPERLKMIGKKLKLKLKESVNEDNIKFSKEEMAQLHKDGKLEKGGHTIEFGESVNESDLGLTYKKGKTVKVTHKKSGKELVIIDKPNVKREYEKIGFFAEGTVNELQMAPFSSQEAKSHINSDIKDMSKLLGKTSQQVIKIMMDGVRRGKYTAMDISRGVQEGPTQRTHFGEMTFIRSLWSKMREKFRRYSKDGKLS